MATKKKPGALSDLSAATDPTAPVDSPMLLKAARPVLKQLEADLTQRAKGSPAVTLALTARHQQERDARRTADAYPQWLEHFVEQVAAAWFLSCVFVRTLEDRGLLGQNRIAGPGALDSQRVFLELAPSLSERDYLLFVFRELTRLPAAKALFDARHNPVWMLAPSAEAAKSLLQLFRSPNAEAPTLRFGQADTRVLGDLYQDLNENVRKRFALLQTPGFVEAFILDRTLTPAIQKFGLDATDIIDPTCGSGHFLLGAFERLHDQQLLEQPGLSPREAARLALNKVYGADINPYAVAVARFRLTLAYLEKAGFSKIGDAPELPLHVVVADSLLHNPQLVQTSFKDMESLSGGDRAGFGGTEFRLEDPDAAHAVMTRKYAAVVGNPPYIAPSDAILRTRYREMYESASSQYQLGAPFTERFFMMAVQGGRVGLINSNGFMKRDFGKTLVEAVLPRWNLDLIVNAEGAYIPGHGTPTVMLFGSAEGRASVSVLSVLSKRGESQAPLNPQDGQVWRSIADSWNDVGFENAFISVDNVEGGWLENHPWILAGGGAIDLLKTLRVRATSVLSDVVRVIGRTNVAGEDDVWIAPEGGWERTSVGDIAVPLVVGESVRDWGLHDLPDVLYPYEKLGGEAVGAGHRVTACLWPWRALLERRTVFGKQIKSSGRPWWEHLEHYGDRLKTPLGITFPFVATHNHFVFDRGGKAFNRTAPVIKLGESATEDDHFALLAYLNSSTACFWMKKMFFNKGYGADSSNARTTALPWEDFYEFTATGLQQLPVPDIGQLAGFGRRLHELSVARADLKMHRVVAAANAADVATCVAEARERDTELLHRMVALQEELDWRVYSLFGLVELPVNDSPPPKTPGSRPFEHRLWRESIGGGPDAAWFSRARYAPPNGMTLTELEGARLGAVESSRLLALIETPDCKRRWQIPNYGLGAQSAAKGWLRLRLEAALRPAQVTRSRRALLAELQTDAKAIALAELVSGDNPDGVESEDLFGHEAVPYLAAHRLSEAGLAKYAQWQRTWETQRQEDAGVTPRVPIVVPPKYDAKDFQTARFYSLRGRLDVPKERFISYPGCESDEDGEPVYGWAGWDHLQRAQALVALYNDRKGREGWAKERLVPMLAGVLELIPWLKQWHNEPSAEFDGLRMGDSYEAFLDGECRGLGLTREVLVGWRPETRAEARAVASAKKTAAKEPRKPKRQQAEE